MAIETTPTDQRRFTSVIASHERLRTVGDAARLIRGNRTFPVAELVNETWEVWRWEYVSARNFYPTHLADVQERVREGGWAHDVYLAQRTIGAAAYLVLASPYTRLLSQMVSDLQRGLAGEHALQFATVDMERVYTALQAGVPGIAATKVTLEMLDEPSLELVSLTGRNPLNSKLHHQIKSVAAPYAIRTEMVSDAGKARVNVDRHGNLWWYQTDESKTGFVFRFLDELASIDSLRLTRHLPLDKASDDTA